MNLDSNNNSNNNNKCSFEYDIILDFFCKSFNYNIYCNESELFIFVSVPSIDFRDIDLNLSSILLEIEIKKFSIKKEILLPYAVNQNTAKATCDKGLLTVEVELL